jgi:hypothetical protein
MFRQAKSKPKGDGGGGTGPNLRDLLDAIVCDDIPNIMDNITVGSALTYDAPPTQGKDVEYDAWLTQHDANVTYMVTFMENAAVINSTYFPHLKVISTSLVAAIELLRQKKNIAAAVEQLHDFTQTISAITQIVQNLRQFRDPERKELVYAALRTIVGSCPTQSAWPAITRIADILTDMQATTNSS